MIDVLCLRKNGDISFACSYDDTVAMVVNLVTRPRMRSRC